ncbi:MAG: hypothetical protein RL885_21845 [Planctomycetota bacterium]
MSVPLIRLLTLCIDRPKIAYNLMMGGLNLRRGRYHQAKSRFFRVLEVDRTHFLAHLLLAQTFFHLGRHARSIEELYQAKKSNYRRFLTLRFRHGDLALLVEKVKENRSAEQILRSLRDPVLTPDIDDPIDFEGERIGDFQDREELERFRAMPPITRDEMDSVDWEKTLSELLRDR